MNRKLKVLSLALAAVFVLSAVSASSALATKNFRSEGNAVVTLTGAQEGQEVFSTDAGKVKCTTATYHGTVGNSPTTTVDVTPTYSGCTVGLLFIHGTIAMNGCFYRFHITGETANGVVTGTVDIVCSGGSEIVITSESSGTNKCTIKVPAQTGLGQVEFTNAGFGSTREVTVDISIATGITYSQTIGTGAGTCATLSNTSNGTYTGNALITGESDLGGGHVGFSVE